MRELRLCLASGYGLLELLVAVVIVSLLTTLAIPAYNGFINDARVEKAIGDIGSLHIKIEEFRLKNNDQMPANLNELNMAIPTDPWGQTYAYLNIKTAGPGKGKLRKDGKLNPLNTDFDLYSIGADGKSAGPLSAKASRDDIVRANNGAFIGLGEEY